jgi:holo-[acyl-carrier protein] synthase
VAIVGIGLDVVEMPRARQLFDRHGIRILDRTLTAAECAYVMSLGDPVPAFAARLAAKEAVYKALQLLPDARAVGWRDIEVRRLPDGRPTIALHGRAVAVLGAGLKIHVTLSHSRDVAAAVAIVES